MPNLLKEIEKCQKRWLEAKRKNDKIMMKLWEKTKEKLEEELKKRLKNE